MNMILRLNKQNAISFHKMFFKGNLRKAIELYAGSEYLQHNPSVKDGIVSLSPTFYKA
jgi:predicted SnoaL-like aldol condensation-catalyzing enzyme